MVCLNVWKTIKIGTGARSSYAFWVLIRKRNYQLCGWTYDILLSKKCIVAGYPQDLDLVVMSVAEMGFQRGARYDVICSRALELGLEICPDEVGPQLRLQYDDQPVGEKLIISREVKSLPAYLFSVERDIYCYELRSYYGFPDEVWDGEERFVFVRPRTLSAA